MLLNLWVKEVDNGIIHQVGTDPHDSIELFDGKPEYVNMQSMVGTLDGEYVWVDPPADDDENYLSVTPDNLRQNRELLHQEIARMVDPDCRDYGCLPRGHKLGETVYTLDYDEEGAYDYTGRILVGGTGNYAFLSPLYNGESDPSRLCDIAYYEFLEDNSCSMIVAPWNACFSSKEDAENKLSAGGIE